MTTTFQLIGEIEIMLLHWWLEYGATITDNHKPAVSQINSMKPLWKERKKWIYIDKNDPNKIYRNN
jgi:hypothetical protein